MEIEAYRESPRELLRTRDLEQMIFRGGQTALDIGARDGHFLRILASHFADVVALDLACPAIDVPGARFVAGKIAGTEFEHRSSDLLFCAEVLAHIPSILLDTVRSELARVTIKRVLIGVLFRGG